MIEATVKGDVLEWALEDSGVNRDEILEAVGLRTRRFPKIVATARFEGITI